MRVRRGARRRRVSRSPLPGSPAAGRTDAARPDPSGARGALVSPAIRRRQRRAAALDAVRAGGSTAIGLDAPVVSSTPGRCGRPTSREANSTVVLPQSVARRLVVAYAAAYAWRHYGKSTVQRGLLSVLGWPRWVYKRVKHVALLSLYGVLVTSAPGWDHASRRTCVRALELVSGDVTTREDSLPRAPLHLFPQLRVGDRSACRAGAPAAPGGRARRGSRRTRDGGAPGTGARRRLTRLGAEP